MKRSETLSYCILDAIKGKISKTMKFDEIQSIVSAEISKYVEYAGLHEDDFDYSIIYSGIAKLLK